MRHIRDNWTEIVITRDGEFIRRFWENPEWDGASKSTHLRHGDVDIEVSLPHNMTDTYTVRDTKKGKIVKSLMSGRASIFINNSWWNVLTDTHAIDILANLEAVWDGSAWIENEIGY